MMKFGEHRLRSKLNKQSSSFQLFPHYYRAFRTVVADTPEMLEECFRIRYDVYCVQRRFEDPQVRTEQLERDGHDGHSVHALLIDRASGIAIGTIRLILNKLGSITGSLPFHALCDAPEVHDAWTLPFERMGEVSRFAISKSRCQVALGEAPTMLTVPSAYVGLGLLRMAVEMAVTNDVDYLCAVMEPPLLRMFTRCGIHFTHIGPLVAYHGLRQPCYVDVATLVRRIEAERPDVWEVITDCGRIMPSDIEGDAWIQVAQRCKSASRLETSGEYGPKGIAR